MSYSSNKIAIVPALILLIPPTIGLRGNIYASMGSRISSYLHTGRIDADFSISEEKTVNIVSSTSLLLLFSLINGILAAFFGDLMNLSTYSGNTIPLLDFYFDLVLISILAALFSAFFMIPATFLLAIGTYKYGLDPDNLITPLTTLAGDIITLPLLFASTDLIFMASFDTKIGIFILLLLLTIILFQLGEKSEIGKRIIKESVLILLFCTFLQFGAGTILGAKLERFIAIAGLLTIVPAFLEDGGAMGGILASRFSTMLHLGILKPELKPNVETIKTFGKMHVIGFLVFSLVAIFGETINLWMNIKTVSPIEMFLIANFAGQILTLVVNVMAYYFSIISFKFGFDPDNVGVPLITSLMDVLGTAILVLAILLFL